LHLKSAPAIVVLGCAVPRPQVCRLGPERDQDCRLGPDPKRVCRLGPEPKLAPGALARRIEAAAALYRRVADQNTLVIASGGRRWAGLIEADVMARELARQGVPANAILRERCSLSTRDNARFAAAILARHGIGAAVVVTSTWHLPRAVLHFRNAGLEVQPVAAADGGRVDWSRRLWRWSRERLLTWVEFNAPTRRLWRGRQA
jgi:uncharacterized SAM-binding protein YcdF (DUF218 family)